MGIEGIAGGERQSVLLSLGFPTFVRHLNNRAERATRKNPLCAVQHVAQHCGLLAVVAAQRAQSEGVAHPENVVARSCLLLSFVRIKLRLAQLKSLVALAIDVDGLPVVEINAVGHQFVFKGCPVVVQLVVGVHTVVNGKTRDVQVLPVLLLYLLVGQQHLHIHRRLRLSLPLLSHLNGENLRLARSKAGEETQLVGRAVLIEVVQLAGQGCRLGIAYRQPSVRQADEGAQQVGLRRQVDDNGHTFPCKFRGI